MAKKKHSVSDSHLMTLWRRAVLAHHGEYCWVCGSSGGVECHHIVHRKHYATRWDWRNGIPVCPECHSSFIDRLAGREMIGERHEFYEYLKEQERMNKHLFLFRQGVTDDEFRLITKKELKEKADS